MPFDPTTPRSRDEVLLQAIVSGDSSKMGEPRDREEEFVKAIADKETLPDYSEASEGDVLQIGTDGPEWGAVSTGTKYTHIVKIDLSNNGLYYVALIVNDSPTPFTLDTYKAYLDAHATSNTPIFANGYQGASASNTKMLIDSIIGKSSSNYIYHGTKINLVDSTITPNETVNVPLGQLTSIHDTVY